MSTGVMVEPKKKGKPGRKPDPSRAMQATLMVRGSSAWKDWAHRFALKMRVSDSDLVDHALAAYAKAQGFEDPPER